MKRSAMPRATKPMKRTRMRAASPRREAEVELRRIVRQLVLNRDGHRCRMPRVQHEGGGGVGPLVEVAGVRIGACSGGLDVDELVPRSSWAAGYLAVDNCQTLCRAHHEWKHGHDDAATFVGLRARAGNLRPPYLLTVEVPEHGSLTWASFSHQEHEVTRMLVARQLVGFLPVDPVFTSTYVTPPLLLAGTVREHPIEVAPPGWWRGVR